MFSFGGKREPVWWQKRTRKPPAIERLGGGEAMKAPVGLSSRQSGLRSKCRVFSAARTGIHERLLAPFRPRRSCRNGKKLAASLNAFFSFLRFGVAMRRGRGEGKVKLTGKEKTLCEAVSPGDGCGAVCSLRYCWCCWWRSCSSTAPPAATTTASSRPCTAAFRPSPASSKCTPAKRARRPPPAAAWPCAGWWSSSPIRTNMSSCCWTATAALSPRPAAPMPRHRHPHRF